MIPVICCSSFEYCQPLGAGAFRRAFTTNVAPQSRAFSRALEIEKLKATLFRGPKGAGDTNDWCITFKACQGKAQVCFGLGFFCLTSKTTIYFQSFWDRVFTSTWGTLKCLAQGHYTAVVGFKPWASRSGVESSTTEPPLPPHKSVTDQSNTT